jgi:hypothetical protein
LRRKHGLAAGTKVPSMARKLLVLLSLTAPLVACGNPHRAAFEAAVQTCRSAYPKKVGFMVARTSCVFHQRERYGFIAPNERSVRSIAMSYATKVDHKRMSIGDAYLAIQRELPDFER